MAHQRKLIRQAVMAALAAGGTVAGTKVFGNRARQIFPAELPIILVYTKHEPAEISIESPREYKRSLTIAIELVAQANDEDVLDDVMDDFCEQVEKIMFIDETFGGVASDAILGETEVELLSEGKNPIGGAKITFTLPYYQRAPLDDNGQLVPFERANIKVDLAPPDTVIESEDDINLPQ